MTMETFKNEVATLIRKYQDISNKEIAANISSACNSQNIPVATTTGDTSGEKKKILYWPFIPVELSIFVGAYFVSTCLTPLKSDTVFIDQKELFFMLSFVVALSSYIASVVRELAKSLPAEITKNRIRKKKHISYMVMAEIPLVITGILILVRLITGSTEWFKSSLNSNQCYDSFLVSLLFVTILLLSVLHIRIWFFNSPWMIEKIPK